MRGLKNGMYNEMASTSKYFILLIDDKGSRKKSKKGIEMNLNFHTVIFRATPEG